MIVSEADAAVMRSYEAYELFEGIFRPLTDELGGHAIDDSKGYVAGGVENLRSIDGQGYIVAPKHMSNWDHFALGRTMVDLPYWSQRERPDSPPLQPRALHWMAKQEMWRAPVVKHFAEYGNAFPVERGTGRGLPEHLVEYTGMLMDNNAVLVIYPEGHRYPDLDQANLHSTVARLALKHGVPVVPAAIVGPTRGPKWPRAVYLEEPIFGGQIDPEASEFRDAKEALMEGIFQGMSSGFQHAGELYRELDPKPNLLRTLNQLTSTHTGKLVVASAAGLGWQLANGLWRPESQR